MPLDEQDEVDFCQLVGDLVQQKYGYPDGADLCFNLLESAVIAETATIEHAARTVAQHIGQA